MTRELLIVFMVQYGERPFTHTLFFLVNVNSTHTHFNTLYIYEVVDEVDVENAFTQRFVGWVVALW